MVPLITVDDLSGYLQRPIDRYSATIAVQGASGLVRNYCGWNISQATETLTVDARGGISLNLPTLKLNDVTEVRVGGDILDPATYSWGTNGVLVSSGDRWPAGQRNIEADVDHGYSLVPDAICIVVSAVAGRLYGNPEGLIQRTSGDDSRSFGSIMSGLEMRLISSFCLT
jgi:hypothetical protein